MSSTAGGLRHCWANLVGEGQDFPGESSAHPAPISRPWSARHRGQEMLSIVSCRFSLATPWRKPGRLVQPCHGGPCSCVPGVTRGALHGEQERLPCRSPRAVLHLSLKDRGEWQLCSQTFQDIEWVWPWDDDTSRASDVYLPCILCIIECFIFGQTRLQYYFLLFIYLRIRSKSRNGQELLTIKRAI